MGQINLNPDTHDLFACLGKEGTLLALEESASRTRTHLGKVVWRGRREHGHELMSGRWRWILWIARLRVVRMAHIDV